MTTQVATADQADIVDNRPQPWWEPPGWLEEAGRWILAHVARRGQQVAGPFQTVKNWSISCVLRVPVDGEDLYFKTVPPLFAQESRITETVARLFPSDVPGVVGVETTRGWILLEDFGPRRLEKAPLAAWEEAIRVLARMQATCVAQTSTLLASGFPDRRPRRLAEQIDTLLADPITVGVLAGPALQRLRNQTTLLRDLCEQIEDAPPPCTLIHGDNHDGNVALRDGKPIFFDWTDACVSHPFFDLVTLLPRAARRLKLDPDAPRRLRDTYLTDWSTWTGSNLDTLSRTFEVAQTLGAIHQAVSYLGIVQATAGHPQEDWSKAVGYFLRRVPRHLDAISRSTAATG